MGTDTLGVHCCPSCGCDELITNLREGVIECSACGRVVESGLLDERSEWRDFNDKDKDTGNNPQRVDRAMDLTKTDAGMGVFFSGGKGLKTLAENLNRVAGKGGTSAHDKRMKLAEDDIKVWCQKLQAPLAVQTLARTLMDDLLRNHLQLLRGKSNNAIHAAVLQWASKMEGHPIHHKRMTVLAKLETKPFNRAHKAVELGIKELATVDPVWHDLYYSGNRSSIQQLIRTFLADLGMSNKDTWRFLKACMDVADVAKPKDREEQGGSVHRPWDSKQPATIAGAILYLMSQLPGAPRAFTIEEMAKVSGQADTTIASAYANLHSYARELVPEYWASNEVLANLPSIKK